MFEQCKSRSFAKLAGAACTTTARAVQRAAIAAFSFPSAVLQRVAIRLSLPFYSTSGALHVLPWLEHATWAHVPMLRPAGLAGKQGQGE